MCSEVKRFTKEEKMTIFHKLTKATSIGLLSITMTTAAVNAEDKTQIRYLNFSAGTQHTNVLSAMEAEFEKVHPTIDVVIETLPWDGYFTKLQTLVAAGRAPDAFELNYENFVTYASRGALTDLTELVANDTDIDRSTYNARAMDVFKHEEKQFALVESFSNVVLFYNKELFDAAGQDYPQESWTWKDELTAAKALTNADLGVWGTFAPIQFWEFYKTIAQNGGSILNQDKTEVTIASRENVEALTWMVDKVNVHKVTPDKAAMSGQSPEDLFLAGKIAMLRTGIWMFGGFADAGFDWDIALEPGNTQKAHHFFANGVAISSKSPNVDAAFEWTKFMTSSDFAVKARVAAGWELPAVDNEETLKEFLEKEAPVSRNVVFDALDTAVVPPVIGNWNQLVDVVGAELEAAELGLKTPTDALFDAQAAIQGLL
jgi:multiple sugar transport system substrate-binding protein